ncbi:winged helix-turn-helix transcriptional regulator [bacterium]|nr:winged helix-turn-helix transcriptional regulator [bacterium]
MTSASSDLVFRAVSDPTRRALLELLAQAEYSVSELLEHFKVSQPAISQHLRLLLDAGLARVRTDGRRRLYSLDAAPLREIHDWAAHYERFWDNRLGRLGQYLDQKQEAKKRGLPE